MSWRTIVISNPAKLSLKNDQIVIKQEIDHTLPIEDISVLIVEDLQTTITSQLLRKLSETGVVMYQCDETHFPCGIMLPFNTHSRQAKVVQMQVNQSEPFKKRIWQKIIKRKIINQALCLQINESEHWMDIHNYNELVLSGDSKNIEAFSAKRYFSYLFGEFNRKEENIINASLNYGYAILRAAIARSIVSYGFVPSFGVHHRSELNSFNLADDFIEPFRPIVDLWTSQRIKKDDVFSKDHRMELVKILNVNMKMNDQVFNVLSCIDMVIKSYATAVRYKEYEVLKLPYLVDLEQHDYE
ncbi:MAG: CRISP-associated protein Cas1 [Kosmotogales bacterium]|nr:CRISP-associated protein Cas1 [Kosmotogales bacterium]